MTQVMRAITALIVLMLLAVPLQAGLEEANELYKARKFEQAEQAFREVLPTLSGARAVDVQRKIGDCLRLRKASVEAIPEYQNILEMEAATESDRQRALYSIAGCYHASEQFDKALETYNKLLARKNLSRVWKFWGLYRSASLIPVDQARGNYQQIIEMEGVADIRLAYAFHALADLERKAGNVDEADRHYAEAIALPGARFYTVQQSIRQISDKSLAANGYVIQLKNAKAKTKKQLLEIGAEQPVLAKAAVEALSDDADVVEALSDAAAKVAE